MKKIKMRKAPRYLDRNPYEAPLTTNNTVINPFTFPAGHITSTNVTINTAGSTISIPNNIQDPVWTYPWQTNVGDNPYSFPNATPFSLDYDRFVGYSHTTIETGISCYSSTEGMINPKKLVIIFQMLEENKMGYDAMLKHLGMEERLFNTVLMEYAMKYQTRRFMELLSTNQNFTKHVLFEKVIKTYH